METKELLKIKKQIDNITKELEEINKVQKELLNSIIQKKDLKDIKTNERR